MLSGDKPYSHYDDFPVVGLDVNDNSLYELWRAEQEISFPGLSQQCCVCFIDMMNSTKTASMLSNMQISIMDYSLMLCLQLQETLTPK